MSFPGASPCQDGVEDLGCGCFNDGEGAFYPNDCGDCNYCGNDNQTDVCNCGCESFDSCGVCGGGCNDICDCGCGVQLDACSGCDGCETCDCGCNQVVDACGGCDDCSTCDCGCNDINIDACGGCDGCSTCDCGCNEVDMQDCGCNAGSYDDCGGCGGCYVNGYCDNGICGCHDQDGCGCGESLICSGNCPQTGGGCEILGAGLL